jgi:acetyl esterase/lipase
MYARWAAWIGLTFAAALFSQIPPDAVTPPADAKVYRDLVYAKTPEKDLLIDLYIPGSGRMPFPVVLYVHGGGWSGGSKEKPPAMRFVRYGYVVASISYRLSQEARFPAQIYDCKAAVRWLRANAGQYHLDPSRIAAWGGSAGGHLVALLGTSGGVKELEGNLGNADYSSRVMAVIDFFGPTDFFKLIATSTNKKGDASGAVERLIGGPLEANRERVRQANPITFVSSEDPPFLIIHGDQDDLVPPGQSVLLYDALKAAAVEVEYHPIKGRAHGFRVGPEVDPLLDEFLAKQFARAARP